MKDILCLLSDRLHFLEKLREEVMSSLQNAPPGSLRIDATHSSPQYYQYFSKSEYYSPGSFTEANLQRGFPPSSFSPSGYYIPQSNHQLAAGLAQKQYDQQIFNSIESEIREIEEMIAGYSRYADPNFYLGLSEDLSKARQNLINPYFISDEEYVAEWLSRPYEGKSIDPSKQAIFTDRGEQVRSRAEKMIANKLYSLGIPYKYECPLYLHGFGEIYPDFTLINIHTRKEAYLEHLGMMLDPEYAAKALKKLDLYAHNGFFIGETLFITYETDEFAYDDRLLASMLKDFIP